MLQQKEERNLNYRGVTYFEVTSATAQYNYVYITNKKKGVWYRPGAQGGLSSIHVHP